MANIRKTFNFRNGVQVDDDNLVVNSFGLVGIGTSIPTEILDVRGTAKIVGMATVTELNASYASVGLATISTLSAGGNISINSGIITAISGVITYYGDGSGLKNIPTSQWIDVNTGLGITSIYAAGFVGVATNFPYFPFQVGGRGNLSTFANGVGIGSEGNILATGIVTANIFSGSGVSLTNLNASNISSGTLSTSRLPTIPNSNLPSNINVSGIITASSFVGNVTGNLTGTANVALDVNSSARLNIDHINSNTFSTGIATVNTRLYSAGSIGILTNNPQSDIQINKVGISSIQLTGTTESIITLGRSVNQTENVAGIRFGNTSVLYPYSNSSAFDIINYDIGNLNYYLHYGNSTGINTGAFRWIYGKNPSNPLMSLTYNGNLGIGVTNPTNTLSVNGIGTFTSSLFVGNNLSVSGNVSVLGANLTADTITATNVNATNLSGNITLAGNQSFPNLNVSGFTTTGILRANVTSNPSSAKLQVNEDIYQFNVFNDGKIGIKTSIIPNEVTLDCTNGTIATGAIGVGTTSFRAAVDFGDAGKNLLGGVGAYMLVPRLTTTQRGTLTPQNGGIIYNTSTNKFQGYANGSWVDLH